MGPKLLMGKHTERIIAINLAAHRLDGLSLAEQKRSYGKQNELAFLPTYVGLKQTPLYTQGQKFDFFAEAQKLAMESRLQEVMAVKHRTRILQKTSSNAVLATTTEKYSKKYRLRGKQKVSN